MPIEASVDTKPAQIEVQSKQDSLPEKLNNNISVPSTNNNANRQRGELKKKEFGSKPQRQSLPRKENDHEDREKNRTDRKKNSGRGGSHSNNAPSIKKSADVKPVSILLSLFFLYIAND